MKWCVIGAGGIADRRTIPALISDRENELVAVMDKAEQTAQAVGEKYGVKWFTDEEKMLSEVDCDAVYIATPVAFHKAQALTVLRFGKHLFMEKPVAINHDDSNDILRAFQKAKKQLSIGYMMKYHNLHEQAKCLIEEDGVGQVNSVRAQFTCWYPDIAGAWRQKKSLGGGGAIMDLGVHCIELIEFLLGEEIDEVKSFYSTRTFSYEVEDGAVLIFRTKSGVLGHIDVNFNVPDKASESKLEIYGSKGYILCKGTLGQEESGTLSHLYSPQGDYSAKQNRTTDKPTEYAGGGENLYVKQLQAFRKAVESGTPDYFYAERAVHVQKLVDSIYADDCKE